jgi:hypothetical protein
MTEYTYAFREIPVWFSYTCVFLLVVCVALLARMLWPTIWAIIVTGNPEAPYQAPMSPLVQKYYKEIATAMHKGQKTVLLEGKIYELKEIALFDTGKATFMLSKDVE